MCVVCNAGPCGGRPAWSTAVGLGPIPYWFAGSNPAPRTTILKKINLVALKYLTAMNST